MSEDIVERLQQAADLAERFGTPASDPCPVLHRAAADVIEQLRAELGGLPPGRVRWAIRLAAGSRLIDIYNSIDFGRDVSLSEVEDLRAEFIAADDRLGDAVLEGSSE